MKVIVPALAVSFLLAAFAVTSSDCVIGENAHAYSKRQFHRSGSKRPGAIEVSRLPVQARQTLALIKRGGPFPYRKDGTTFQNRERRLPVRKRGYYKEYTVKTPGRRNRGARRIVVGAGGEFYYTDDHYRTFKRIKE